MIETPLQKRIESNLKEIERLLPTLSQEPRKDTYFAFLAWIYIWETMKLIRYASCGEILKSLWIERITRYQQEITFHCRRNRPLRGLKIHTIA